MFFEPGPCIHQIENLSNDALFLLRCCCYCCWFCFVSFPTTMIIPARNAMIGKIRSSSMTYSIIVQQDITLAQHCRNNGIILSIRPVDHSLFGGPVVRSYYKFCWSQNDAFVVIVVIVIVQSTKDVEGVTGQRFGSFLKEGTSILMPGLVHRSWKTENPSCVDQIRRFCSVKDRWS